MHDQEHQLTTALRLPPGKTVEDCLLEDRHKQHFIGRHLPFSLADDPIYKPVRYYLGDEWLDLIVLYFPDEGWEVQVADQSCEDFDLGDVYMDLKDRLRAELAVQTPPSSNPFPSATIKDILARLERLEQVVTQPGQAKAVESPYFNAEEAAAYLRLKINALYSLVERRKLRPLPGHRKYRFTREMLDAFLRGE
jgi:excisionase family DNA binding protein